MLWLVREQKPDIDVVYFDAFPSPTKHRFALDIAQQYDLKLHSPVPMGRDVIGKGSHVEIIEAYQIAPKRVMALPIEAEPDYTSDKKCLCALDKMHAPVADCQLHFDGIFIGHRNDDVDPTQGAVPLESDAVIYEDFRYLYPLKDWTEKDIWEASKLLGIPQNEARYFQHDMTANNDYYPLCTKCLGSDSEVICPQTNLPLPGMRAILKLDDRREAWRKTFVNINQDL